MIRGQTGCNTLGVNQLAVTGPLDAFYLRIKVAFIVGVILSSPVWLYQIWAFIAPGLYAREKRWGYIFVGTAVPLFLDRGRARLPVAGPGLHYLLGLTPPGVANLIYVDQYMSFVIAMMLAFGIAFELPLLIVMLNLAGILTHERFRKWRRMLIFARLPGRRHRQPEPGPDHHADPGRRLRGVGRGGRVHRLVPRPPVGPAAPRPRTPAWPTTSCPRSSSPTTRRPTAASTDAGLPDI